MLTALTCALATIGLIWLAVFIFRFTRERRLHELPEQLGRIRGTGVEGQDMHSLAAHLMAPVVEGNDIEPLVNGVEIFPAMVRAIRSAERSIDFLSFVYWTGDIAQQFARELSAAARRGLVVRVLLDAFGAKDMDEELIDAMRDAGCRVVLFNPLTIEDLGQVNHRTHRKVLVIDGHTGFTGGVGIAEEWAGDAGDPDHWRDTHFRIEGPIVRYLHGAFAQNWREATGEAMCWNGAGVRARRGSAKMVPIQSTPVGTVSPVYLAFWWAITSARKSLRIATPYFLPSPRLARELREAIHRGVDVELMVPGKKTDQQAVWAGSLALLGDVVDAGGTVHVYDQTMMHTKTLVVDDRWALIGSANFDNRSFELHYELNLAVFDRAFVRTLLRQFRYDLRACRRFRREEAVTIPAWDRLRGWLARGLREQL